MKQLLLIMAMVCTSLVAAAQAKDTTLKEYIGKYTFPEGSFVTSAEITMQNDVLSVTSAQGGGPLEKRGKDTFALTEFEGGMMYFYRNTAGKVARIKVEVGDVLLEGTKDGVPTTWINRNKYFYVPKQTQAR